MIADDVEFLKAHLPADPGKQGMDPQKAQGTSRMENRIPEPGSPCMQAERHRQKRTHAWLGWINIRTLPLSPIVYGLRFEWLLEGETPTTAFAGKLTPPAHLCFAPRRVLFPRNYSGIPDHCDE